MLDTAFQHRRSSPDIGDLFCSPGHYFDFGDSAFFDLSETLPPGRLAVLGGGHVYKSCAIAMSPLFDTVLFFHNEKSEGLARVPGMPAASNYDGSMEDAIRFIASGATVVTNSYHGAYWAMCLGRRVLCVPFNHKFRHFRENPVFADPGDWPEKLHLAERRDGVLEEARERNTAFYAKVRNLL